MLAPLRLPPFRRLLSAYVLSGAGDWLGEIALSVLLLQQGGGVLAVAALWIIGRLVPAPLAPFALRPIERLGRWRLSVLLSLQCALFAALTVLAAGGGPLALILLVALIDGVLAICARGAMKAAMAAITTPAGLLREGNTVLGVAFTIAAAVGPIAAGLLIAASGAVLALALDALSFALAALLCPAVEHPADESRQTGVLAPLRRALHEVRGRGALPVLIVADGVASMFLGLVIPVELVFVTGSLGGTEADFGIVLAAWGVGAVIGSAALSPLRRVSTERLLLAGAATMVAGYLGMGAAATVSTVVAFSLLGGVGNGLAAPTMLTAVQSCTPSHLQLEINTTLEALHTGAPGTGYLLGGLLAAAVSPQAVYFVAGLGALAVVGLTVMRLRTADPGRPIVAPTAA